MRRSVAAVLALPVAIGFAAPSFAQGGSTSPAAATTTPPADGDKDKDAVKDAPTANSSGKRGRPPVGNGVILYVTSKEAFLNVGREDGLPTEGSVKVVRRKKVIGECQLVEVAAERARCKSDRVLTGDNITFQIADPAALTRAAEEAKAKNKKRDPLPLRSELNAARKLVEKAPIERVPFKKGPAGIGISSRAAATLRQEFWSLSTAPGGGVFARTALDMNGRVGFGSFFTQGSARVVGDLLAPPDQRFRPGELVEVYVWGASIGVNDVVTGELGRFRPRLVPGATLLDGVQLGARFAGVELGVYGGAVPDVVSIFPTAARLTGGVYGGADLNPAPGFFVLPRARASVLASGDFVTTRGELEAQTQLLWADIGSAGVSARGGLGANGAVSLDAVRADVLVSAVEGLSVSADYRYLAPLPFDFDQLGLYSPPAPAALPIVGGAHHSSARVAYAFGGSSNVEPDVASVSAPPAASTPEAATTTPADPKADAKPTDPKAKEKGKDAKDAKPNQAELDAELEELAKELEELEKGPAAATPAPAPASGASPPSSTPATGETVAAAPSEANAPTPTPAAPTGPWLVVGASGGAGFDTVRQVARGWVGPELGLPTAFGSFGGLDVGYAEELGEWPGRTAWVGTNLAPIEQLRIITRVSYFESEALGDSLRELGLMAIVDAPVLDWLGLRLRAYGQQAMPSADGFKRVTPSLLTAELAVTGQL